MQDNAYTSMITHIHIHLNGVIHMEMALHVVSGVMTIGSTKSGVSGRVIGVGNIMVDGSLTTLQPFL